MIDLTVKFQNFAAKNFNFGTEFKSVPKKPPFYPCLASIMTEMNPSDYQSIEVKSNFFVPKIYFG